MTRNWNDLPNELKWMIVDRMDIITRFRLKMCSKSDKCLVESVPFYCEDVRVTGADLKLDVFGTEHFQIIWNDRTTTISIQKPDKEDRLIKLSSVEEGVEMIKCMFRAFMSPQNIRTEYLYTNMNLSHLSPPPDFKLHAKNLNLFCWKQGENEKWLDILAYQPEELIFRNECKRIGSHSKVKDVNSLKFYTDNDIDDEQLMNLKATELTLEPSIVTDNGINKLAKKMINEDYPIDSIMRFQYIVPLNWDRIIEGLNVKPVDIAPFTGMEFRVNMSAEKDLIIYRFVNSQYISRYNLEVRKREVNKLVNH